MTGVYLHQGNTYMAISKAKSFNSISKEWESHILFCLVNTSEYRTMEKNEFLKTFEKISDIWRPNAS